MAAAPPAATNCRTTAFVNKLSYSHSSAKMYEACPRQYWFKRFAGWDGWLRDAPPEKRRMWLLGKIKNRHMWKGTGVHTQIAWLVQSWREGKNPTIQEIQTRTLQTFRAQFIQSKGGDLFANNTKAPALREHVYGESVENSEWKSVVESAVKMLQDFVVSSIAAEIKAVPESSWMAIENPDPALDKPSEFDLDGITVYAKLDAAWLIDDKTVLITDWKTGRGETSNGNGGDQLPLYALYVERVWNLKAVCREYHLSSGTSTTWTPSAAEISGAAEKIRTSMERLRALTKETPAGVDAAREDFPPAPARRVCRSCSYAELCPEAMR